MADKTTAELRAEIDALRVRLYTLIDTVETKLDALDERERRIKELEEQMNQAAQAAKEKARVSESSLSALASFPRANLVLSIGQARRWWQCVCDEQGDALDLCQLVFPRYAVVEGVHA